MTSINVALSSAVSSLLMIEKQMGVASNNIANANTTGYSKQTVQVGSAVSSGVGTGVVDLGTVSDVDKFLQDSVLKANTQSSQATAFNTLYQNLQSALGQITTNETGGNDLASQLGSLETDLSTLATTPQNTSLTTNVVQDLDDLASNLRSLSTQIQQLRTTADTEISQTVTDANTQLHTIDNLNRQIEQAQGLGEPTASLSDLRMNALNALSSDLGVSYFIDKNGGMQISTPTGQDLLVGNTVNELSHTAVSISGNTTYPSGGIGGIMVGTTDITTQISSGTLAGLIQQRDTELPNAQNSLNTLAQNLSATLNSVANQGSANPPPATLTSAVGIGFSATDAVTPAASPAVTKVQISMVDSAGQVQSTQSVDLSGAVTVDDVITDINTAFGSTVATLNGSGQLVLTSTTAGQGIAVSTTDGSLNGTNFSSFFHLNDVITGGNSAATIAVNAALSKNATLFPTATLNTAGTTPPYAGIGAGDGSTATALENALLATQSFTAGTALGTTAETSTTTALNLAGSFAIVGGSGGGIGVTITSTMSLDDIAAAINAAAGTSGVTASVVGNGVHQLQISTGGSSLKFTGVSGNVLSSLGLSSAPSGYLGATTTTLTGYATAIISDVSTRASNAATAATTKQTTLATMASNLSSQSGVNTDEEMAHLTELQSSYAASAKIVSTVQTMFNSLLQAVS